MTAVEVPGLDKQNGATLGRLLGRGTVGAAEEGADGVMRATVRIPEDELVYEPGVLVLPHGGVLELTLINDDKNTHCAVLPSNGDTQFIWLVSALHGIRAVIRWADGGPAAGEAPRAAAWQRLLERLAPRKSA